MRILFKIYSSILAFSLFSFGVFALLFTPLQAKAGFFSSILGDEAYAQTEPSQSSCNYLNCALLATVSPASKDENNDVEISKNLNIVSENALLSAVGSLGVDDGTDNGGFSLKKMIVYTVEDGDTLSEIADKENTSVNTIRWENNISGQKISVGQKLNIFPDFVGVKHIVKNGDTIGKIADKYDAIAEDISVFNDISDGDTLKPGDVIFVINGIIKTVVPKSTSSFGSSYTTPSNTKVQSGYYIRPVQGRITSSYGSRKGGFHPGVDIGNSRGTPVMAAADGIVVKVVNSCAEGRKSCGGGYGNHVDVKHENGDKTRYAHLNKTFVGVGQPVSQGQPIGAIGNTGNSTGPHLHWEIENSNGSKMKPPV